MHAKLPYTAVARRFARIGWTLSLVPPLCAGGYALLTGGSPDWFRFFVILAMAIPTALAATGLGVLCEISTTLALRSARPAKPAMPAQLAAE